LPGAGMLSEMPEPLISYLHEDEIVAKASKKLLEAKLSAGVLAAGEPAALRLQFEHGAIRRAVVTRIDTED
jgi:hypothetical protein